MTCTTSLKGTFCLLFFFNPLLDQTLDPYCFPLPLFLLPLLRPLSSPFPPCPSLSLALFLTYPYPYPYTHTHTHTHSPYCTSRLIVHPSSSQYASRTGISNVSHHRLHPRPLHHRRLPDLPKRTRCRPHGGRPPPRHWNLRRPLERHQGLLPGSD